MNYEKNKISGSQLTHLTVAFVMGSSLLIAFASRVTSHDTWIASILGCILGLVFSFTYTSLYVEFPNKTLIEISNIIYGKFIGTTISLLYFWFYFSLIALNLRYIGDFFSVFLMPETPLVAFFVPLIIVSAFAVNQGIEVIARCSSILIAITISTILVVTILVAKDINFKNLYPLFESPTVNILQSSHIFAAIPYGESIVFMMFLSNVNKANEVKKSIINAFMFCGVLFLIITIRNTAVLGITDSFFNSPSFQVARLINIGEIFTRLEIFVAISFFATVFIKITLFYYASVVCMAKILNLKSYKSLIIPFGIIVIGLSIIIFDFSLEIDYFGANIFPIYSLPFEFLLPLFSLALVKFKNLFRQKRST